MAFIRFDPYYYKYYFTPTVSVVQVEMVCYSDDDDALGAGCAPRVDRPTDRPTTTMNHSAVAVDGSVAVVVLKVSKSLIILLYLYKFDIILCIHYCYYIIYDSIILLYSFLYDAQFSVVDIIWSLRRHVIYLSFF